MVGGLEGEDARPAGGAPAAVFRAISTASAPEMAKKTCGSSTGAISTSRRASSTRSGWAMHVPQGVEEPAGLLAHRLDHPRMAVPHGRDPEAGGEVDIEVAVDVPDVRAPASSQRIGGLVSRAEGVDPGASSVAQVGRELAGARPRRRDDDLGGGGRRRSHLAPAGERAAERHLVGVLDVAAHRHAEGEAGDPHPPGLEQAGEVEGGRLPLDVGVGGEDDLLDPLQAREQAGDGQAVGADPAVRGEGPQQDVVEAVVLARALDGLEVERLLDDADARRGPAARRSSSGRGPRR